MSTDMWKWVSLRTKFVLAHHFFDSRHLLRIPESPCSKSLSKLPPSFASYDLRFFYAARQMGTCLSYSNLWRGVAKDVILLNSTKFQSVPFSYLNHHCMPLEKRPIRWFVPRILRCTNYNFVKLISFAEINEIYMYLYKMIKYIIM